MDPYFEELGHIVDGADELLSDPRVLDTLSMAHNAIGYRYGITHTELKLTARGPVIVEINGRLGGDLIPLLARYATGIDPGAAAVDVALGIKPEIPGPTRNRHVGLRFAYPDEDCVVESVHVPEPGGDNGVLRASAMVQPGAHMKLPPAEFMSRHAYVICAGRDSDECAVFLDKALSEVRLTANALLPDAVLTS
jgi:biotin carboxylase